MNRIVAVVALLCLVAACGGSAGPEDALNGFFAAVQAGDGEKAASLISQSSVDMLGGSLDAIRSDTSGEQLSILCGMMGIETISQEEFAAMDTREFVALMLGSEMMRGEFPASVEILSTEIEGDRAVLNARGAVGGETEEREIIMVREDGAWKLDMASM